MPELFKVEAINPDGSIVRIDHKEDYDPIDPDSKVYVHGRQAAIRVTPIDTSRKPTGEPETYIVGTRDRIVQVMSENDWTPTSFLENYADEPDSTQYIMSVRRQVIRKYQ